MKQGIVALLWFAAAMTACRTPETKSTPAEPARPERIRPFEVIDADTLRLSGEGMSTKHKDGPKAETEAELAAQRHAVRDLAEIFGPYCSPLENMAELRKKKENELRKLMKATEKTCRVTEDGTICKVTFILRQKGIQESATTAQQGLPKRQNWCLMM